MTVLNSLTAACEKKKQKRSMRVLRGCVVLAARVHPAGPSAVPEYHHAYNFF
jgi:hypothetical protein